MTTASLTKYGACVSLFLCLLLLPSLYSWVVSLFAPGDDVIALDLHGMEIAAVYKKARRNEDGSIDLTINIPNSAAVLKRLLNRQEQIKYNLTAKTRRKQLDDGNFEPPKTFYPVTMDTPYIINSPHVCDGVDPLHVLVIVHTSTGNFQRRRLIRETWASKNLMTTRNLRLMFVLGLNTNSTVQRMIENEHVVYQDLVQGRFLDSYHNLTHKGVLVYRWIYQHCSHAQLILKVDDDMFVNPFLFYQHYFPKITRFNRTIACHVRPKNTSPIERTKTKWKVQEYEFRGYKHYPFPYCNGYVVMMTPDIIKAMFTAAYTTPFFWVDDVYLYGMLPAKVGGIRHLDIHKNMSLSMKTGLKCYRGVTCYLLATHVPQESALIEEWQRALETVGEGLRSELNPVYLIK